ncbi:MAG: putative membrane protein, partial [Parasphingorhabdus sp.]
AQQELVDALKENRTPDLEPGKNGLLRSRHNNYLTLPVLFIMISSHFPSTYGNSYGWAVLIAVSAVSVAVRHFYNIRHRANAMWVLPVAFIALVGIMWVTAPKPLPQVHGHLTDAEAMTIVTDRCISCHAKVPTQNGFGAPPAGLMLETVEQVKINADRVYVNTVVNQIMPIGNITGMTEPERAALGNWLEEVIHENQK